MLISVSPDIFRSADLSGWGPRSPWVLLVATLPYLGALVYVNALGKMHQRAAEAMAQREDATRQHIQEPAGSGGGSPSTPDEIAKLAQLLDHGHLTDVEFAAQKAKILA